MQWPLVSQGRQALSFVFYGEYREQGLISHWRNTSHNNPIVHPGSRYSHQKWDKHKTTTFFSDLFSWDDPKSGCPLALSFCCCNPCRAAASIWEHQISGTTQQVQGKQDGWLGEHRTLWKEQRAPWTLYILSLLRWSVQTCFRWRVPAG